MSTRPRRRTRQRALVAEALARAGTAVSAQELHERLRSRHPRLGLATVYRALEGQVADGLAQRLEREGHVSAYVACAPEHHHHLVCTSCQRVEEVDEAVVGSMLRTVRDRHGFAVDHARFDLYGQCAACARRGRSA